MLISRKNLSEKELEILKTLGFKIQEFSTNYHIFVPNKWYIYVVSREKHFIYDPQKRLRVEYLVKSSSDDIVGSFKFYTRYSIEYEKPYIFVKDNETNRIIFDKMEANIFGKPQMRKILKNRLNQKYPDWQNPLAYWS